MTNSDTSSPVTRQVETDAPALRVVESYRSGWNLLTVHPPESYPGLDVVKGGSAWLEWVILGREDQTVVARGGEEMYAYTTSTGVSADGFTLRAGDRATIVKAGLPASLVEWRVERAARGRDGRQGGRSA